MKRVRLTVEADCAVTPSPDGYSVSITSLEDEFLDMYSAVIKEVTVIGEEEDEHCCTHPGTGICNCHGSDPPTTPTVMRKG
jgi:hypothetical protein